ncbi:MAG: AraC family transcriptional regulator [Butyrivibrio sp.]|nr:AraC family transcriptional regulator [Butyrivibrio sp.]
MEDNIFTILNNIPIYSYFKFSQILTQIYENMTNKKPNIRLEKNSVGTEDDSELMTQLLNTKMKNIENNYHNNFWDAAKIFLPLIEKGDTEAMKNSSSIFQEYNYGKYSEDNLKNSLVTSIMSITMSMSAAIRGGLDEITAFSLSEVLIRKCIASSSPAEIEQTGEEACYTYAHLVKKTNDKKYTHSSIYNSIQYIREHVYSDLTVQELAERSGYSLAHFSRLFKKECGFSPNVFIYSCKLYESKHLLRSTSLSISEISSMLAFSSQSHFQRRFKEKFHITPKAYKTQCQNSF